jgi:hypothetical protein
MDWTPIILASIPGIVSLTTVIYQARHKRKIVDADAAKTITEAATEAVKICREQCAKLSERVTEVEKTRDDCHKELAKVKKVLVDAGLDTNGDLM